MPGRKTKDAIIVAALALAGCASTPAPGPAGHVILDREHASTDAYWEPTEEEVQGLEREMARLFASPDRRVSDMRDARLSDYGMQYYGTVEKGRRLIIGKGVHISQQSVRELQAESNRPGLIKLETFGGGRLFFTVAYDPLAKKILYVRANAPL